MLPLNTAGALGTGVAHVGHVVIMAVDLVVELVVGSLYHIAAHTTTALGFLEMLLADWFVLKEQVCVSQRLLTDIALKLMCVGGEAEAQAGLPSYSPGGRRSCC